MQTITIDHTDSRNIIAELELLFRAGSIGIKEALPEVEPIFDGGKCRKCFQALVQCIVGPASSHPTQNCRHCGSPPTGWTCPKDGKFWQ